MKVVILTSGQGNQTALCHKIARRCEISCIVISENIPRRPPQQRFTLLANRIQGRIVGQPFIEAWRDLQERYRTLYPSLPEVPIVKVKNVNDSETLHIFQRHHPDAVIVSGTNMLTASVIEAAGPRILNLHTGISPYVKGGPNCTNWCLAERKFHLIGNTVMWIDPGIDSGAIIATEQTPLTGLETLGDLHWKVMEHAHALYTGVISKLAQGQVVPKVRQDTIGPGRTFYTAEWNGLAMLRARSNFRHHFNPIFFQGDDFRTLSRTLSLFPVSP